MAGVAAAFVAGSANIAAAKIVAPPITYSAAPGWQSPMPGGRIGTPFGERGPMWHWKGYHTGDDYPEPTGTHIRAAHAGKVIVAGWISSAYGYGVEISVGHGLTTMYCHMSSVHARTGARVDAGDYIGNVGSTGNVTGPHLHFEIRRNGEPISPKGFTRGVPMPRTLADIGVRASVLR